MMYQLAVHVIYPHVPVHCLHGEICRAPSRHKLKSRSPVVLFADDLRDNAIMPNTKNTARIVLSSAYSSGRRTGYAIRIRTDIRAMPREDDDSVVAVGEVERSGFIAPILLSEANNRVPARLQVIAPKFLMVCVRHDISAFRAIDDYFDSDIVPQIESAAADYETRRRDL